MNQSLRVARPEIIDRPLVEAAWRYQLVAQLLDGNADPEYKRDLRQNLLSRKVHHPWRGAIRLSSRTLRRWCRRYKRGGLKGLVPKTRSDSGSLRALPPEALEYALELRREDGRRTVPKLLKLLALKKEDWQGIKRSTLDRHLRACGSFRQRVRSPQGPFQTFEAKEPNSLWQGDVLHGPVVLFGDKPRRCRIVCWMDDFSRHITHIEAYPDESLPAIEDSLKKAILKFGRASTLFVDNAFVYSGKTFSLACSLLGIAKIHSTPRYPVSRGKQERLFLTLRQQLLQEIENLEPLSHEQFNRCLVAWADQYHRTKHSRTGQTPRERFANRPFRPVSLEQLEEAFWQWDRRTVSSTGEIKFAGNIYRVDATRFQGRHVVRYDPFDLTKIHLWRDGQRVATATCERLVHRTRRGKSAPARTRDSEAAQRYLEDLVEAHDERLAQERNQIDYRNLSDKEDTNK